MKHNNLPSNIVERIELETQKIKKKYKLINKILREDVFDLLEGECTVLYYPLDDQDVNAMHITRRINDRKEDFVYINTRNPIEKQVYAAAHELGHIWRVDELVGETIDVGKIGGEAIINRFAAEMLMPKDVFIPIMFDRLRELGYGASKIMINRDDLVRVTVFLMNEFLVPYKAVVLRMEELDVCTHSIIEFLEDLEKEKPDTIRAFVKEGSYVRLGIRTERKSMGQLVDLLNKAEKMEVLSEKKISNIRKQFDLKKEDVSSIREISESNPLEMLVSSDVEHKGNE